MKIIYYAALALGFLISPVRAELKIDVNGAMREPMPIAFPQMSGSGEAASYGERIREVVIADLERSGLFRIIPEDSYIQTFTSIDELPRFTDWKALNAAALIQSAISEIDAANLRVEFRLWDVYSEEQMKGQSFTTTKDNWRRVAHVIADAVYERLTGEKGYFDTRIVYISESGPATRRIKRLAIMDQDGENHKFLTNGASMALTPRFSPNLQKITYLSYAGATPKVYMLDIETGEQKLVGEFKGMTFAPVFSPDSSKLLLSYAKGSTTDIYELDLKTGKAYSSLPALRSTLRPATRRTANRSCLTPTAAATSSFTSWTPTAATSAASVTATAAMPRRYGRRARLHRLHQNGRRTVLYRRHVPGRQRRTSDHQRLSGGSAGLGA